MAAAEDEYVIYYYGNIAGRAEFIRLVLEEAGAPYRQVGDIGEMMKIRDGTMPDFYPAFAPPLLKKGSFTLAQTPVICRYLGRELGLWPQGGAENEWHAEQINATVHDFIAEGRLVFHGKGFIKSYYQQKEETQPYINWFKAERLHKWLGVLERFLAANEGGKGFMVGPSLSYVDLVVLHVLRATASQFPGRWAELSPTVPLLTALKARLEARPRLAAYFKSERCRPFEGNSMM